MTPESTDNNRIAVIGLGYVGLPLAVALARHFPVTGFDIDHRRIEELNADSDRTGEIDTEKLSASTARFTFDVADIGGQDIYIVTVPTPVNAENKPDLDAVLGASRTVGSAMAKGAVVVFESTVYPGVTENIAGPTLEQASGMVCGRDFFLGYSPERINPGDKEHTIDRITKVVAGQTAEVTELLADIYGRMTEGGVFKARDIRTAEAAKVIENAQRDINIAFINEVASIFHEMDIPTHDVLAAAGTKWNFLPFAPGLVGGHCIGIDPFYLAHAAQAVGHSPEIILAGRRINDAMGGWIANSIAADLAATGTGGAAQILVLGLAFKENVSDLRNSRVIDVVNGLKRHGHQVAVHDPFADGAVARADYGVELLETLDGAGGFGCVIGAVAHAPYGEFTTQTFVTLLADGGLVADIKGMWRGVELPPGLRSWQF